MLLDAEREAEIQNLFIKAFADQEILVQLRCINSASWDEVLKNSFYVPVAYTPAMIEYQMSYIRCFADQLIDLSVVIYHEEKAVGVWPISLKIADGQISLVNNEGPICKPLFIEINSLKISKKLYNACLISLNKMYTLLGEYVADNDFYYGKEKKQSVLMIQPYWEGTHLFFLHNADEWYRKCMERNAQASVHHELYVDLTMNYDDIKKNIRKRFKSLVNLGERLWNVKIYDAIDDAVFDEYRQLHRKVAGRVTRSLDTWELQKQAINNQDAFLVALYNEHHVLVGGGLFELSKDEAVYGVGVYERELFDKPLGHVVQMRAIQHMQALGIKWYKIGHRPYKGDSTVPTEKECNIGYFKEGFATHMFLNVLTKYRFN